VVKVVVVITKFPNVTTSHCSPC